jgi:hypothetical protein
MANPTDQRPQQPTPASSPDRRPPTRPARDVSSNLPVDPPTTSTPPNSGVNLPQPVSPPQPSQSGFLELEPGSLPVDSGPGDAAYGAVRHTPAPTQVPPMRGSMPFRPASRLGR